MQTVTGHKSETSLKTYFEKPCEKKVHASEILSKKWCGKKSKQVKPCLSNIDFLCWSHSTFEEEENISVDLNNAHFELELYRMEMI